MSDDAKKLLITTGTLTLNLPLSSIPNIKFGASTSRTTAMRLHKLLEIEKAKKKTEVKQIEVNSGGADIIYGWLKH
jgi:hypothetical protein